MKYANILSLPYYLVKSARPRQWVKNLAVYAALLFSGFLFYIPNSGIPYFLTVTWAFLLFCVLTASIYLINDVVDIGADRNHPFKSKRPIASGKLPVWLALSAAGVGIAIVLFFSFFLNPYFRILAIAYLLLQFAYFTIFKHIPILDVVSIASGFIIRIYVGAVVVDLHPSVWFLLTVLSAALFLAVAKRQSERTLLENNKEDLGSTRKILTRYSQRLLDQYTSMFATATWLTYALFTFQQQANEPVNLYGSVYSFLPKAWRSEKLLMLTIPLVIFAVMRYLQLVYENNRGESPDKVLFSDKPMLIAALSFGAMVFIILYLLQ